MEKKQKDLISMFLLIVGVIFILVAGGIFVTTAWQYLPVFVKQLALLVVAGGMFGGSYKLSKNEKLIWISETLFHLGNAFVGFFVIAVMGGVVENNTVGNAFKVMTASGTMAMITSMKLIVKKRSFDFVAATLLVDILLISGCVAFDTTFNTYMYLLAGLTITLAIMDALQQKEKVSDGFSLSVAIVYLIHAGIYAMLASFASLFVIAEYEDMAFVLDGIIWFAVVVAMTTISWKARRNIGIRVINSLVAIWFVFVAVNGICHILGGAEDFSVVMVFTTLFASILTVWLRRNELIGLLIVEAAIIPFGQLFGYWLDALLGLFDGIDTNWDTMYNPYSFVLGGTFFALYIVKYGCAGIREQWRNSRLLKLAMAQMVTGSVMWLASKMVEAWLMIFFLLIVIDLLLVVSLFKNATAQKIFMTPAVFFLVTAVFCQPFVEIPSVFMVEWVCFLIAINIVLFRFIWYDYKEQLSMVYFAATCIILGVLLLNNLYSGGIGNVLILGMTGIVMLITAAMHNDKKYVIASSTTLILLVLYLTREFWLSIAWWIYLFAAGVVLVLLAVKKAKEA